MKNLPEFATATGDHRYDHLLDDRSLEAYSARIEWCKGVLAKVEAWKAAHRSTASKEAMVSARLLRHHCRCMVEGGKFRTYLAPLNRLEGPHSELPQLVAYMKFETVQDYGKYLSRLKAIPAALHQVTALLREGVATGMVPPEVGLEGVVDQLAATEKALDHCTSSPLWRPCPGGPAGALFEDEAKALLCGPIKAAFGALRHFVASKYVPAVAALRQGSVACVDLPGGQALYEECLRFHTGSAATAAEIHATGLREVARIGVEMAAACAACGMPEGGDVKGFLAALKADPKFVAASGPGLVATYRDVCMRILPELPKLFSIRCMPRTPFAVIATPDAQAEAAPSAYYLGGAGDGSRPGTFFVNTSLLPDRPTYEAEALALHEAIPGHHTQTMLAAENEAMPPFRRFMDDRRYQVRKVPFPLARGNALMLSTNMDRPYT